MVVRLNVWVFMAMVMTMLGACGPLADVRESSKTVDDGVHLLREIDDRGTWLYLSDGADALRDAGVNWQASLTFSGPTGEAAFRMDVDAGNRALLTVESSGETRQYLISGYGQENPQVYLVIEGRYRCVESGEDVYGWQDGLRGIFDAYAVQAAGMQTLSVVEKQDDELTVARRDADLYHLDSRLEEALRLVADLDHPDLQRRIDEAGRFVLAGRLALDQDTGALLLFESDYTRPGSEGSAAVRFEVTQWGGEGEIALPAPDRIDTACP